MPGIDSYTKACGHFNGVDGATAYTDPVAGAYTFVGTAQLDTAQSKFGGASLLLDGNSDYVTLPDSANWYFQDGDFTIDFWARLANTATDMTVWSQYTDASNYFYMYHSATDGWAFKLDSALTLSQAAVTTSANTWTHVALVRYGNNWNIYKDGTSVASKSSATTFKDLTGTANVGQVAYPGYPFYLNGWIDELRISKGIARWTANFTPPTLEYDNINTGIKKISSVAYAGIKKIEGVSIAGVKKFAGVA